MSKEDLLLDILARMERMLERLEALEAKSGKGITVLPSPTYPVTPNTSQPYYTPTTIYSSGTSVPINFTSAN